jgi:DNA repair exonuclease SbcCD nuclease subunit
MPEMRFTVLADTHIGHSISLALAEHRRRAFSEAFTRTVDAIIEAGGDYVFTGHYHRRCREKRLPDGS